MPMILIASSDLSRLLRLRKGLIPDYEVQIARTNAEAWASTIQNTPDAIVIDVSSRTEEMDPWLLCSEFSAIGQRHLIALIRPGHNRDRLRALRTGVIQCLTLPVSTAEVSAFLKKVLDDGPIPLPGAEAPAEGYQDEWLRIDLTNRWVCHGGQRVTLTTKEFELMRCLVREDGNVVSAEKLSQMLWTSGSYASRCNRLKTYISRLRQKIEQDPTHPRYIISQHGFGYAFVRPSPELN